MILTPFDQQNYYIWLNGELIKSQDAKIHLLTHSLHYSGAAFEGERSYNGKVFKLEEHTNRLLTSAKALYLEPNFNANEIIKAHELLIKENAITDSYIRPLIFRGDESINITNAKLSTNLLIVALPAVKKYDKSLRLHISRWVKSPVNSMPPQVKSSGHYNMMIIAQTEAKIAGFDDAILLDQQGFIAECTVSNIFFVKEDRIITPIADVFLNGITRQTIIGLAKELGLEVEEKRITLGEIQGYQECFLTGTAMEVASVESIELLGGKLVFGSNRITQILTTAYHDLVRD